MFQIMNNICYEIALHLIKDSDHLRSIARAIGFPTTTVLKKINGLIEEGILDYRIEGKNKVFFLKKNSKTRSLIVSAENYKLTGVMIKYPKLEIIIDELTKRPERLIILFGSYAKFRAKKDSDIDLYVETTNRSVKKEIESINSKIKVKIGPFKNDSLLIKEIIKNHVIIKGVEEFYAKTKFFE
jgi:predicted nucleotidyltransferase